MRRIFRNLVPVAFAVTMMSAHGGWLEDVQTIRPGAVPPPSGDLTAKYIFGWSGIEAAEAVVRLRRDDDGTWAAEVRGGTTGIARSLWKLDADYSAVLSEQDWRSVTSHLTEKYARYRTEEKTEFLPGGARSWRESTKEGAKPPRWKDFNVPGLRDIAAALMLARSQPLANGDKISLAVFPGQWMYLVRIEVEGRGKIRWQGVSRDVIRANLQIDAINRDYTLSPHKKFQRGMVWVSDDELRIPLRVEVKVFVGHVFAELAEDPPSVVFPKK